MVRRPIRVMHVPKAAGTSLADAIRVAAIEEARRTDAPVSICPEAMDTSLFGSFAGWDGLGAEHAEMVQREPALLAEYDVVMGHYRLDHLVLGHRPADVVTVLREPRARLLSLYSFWRSWSEKELAAWDPYEVPRLAMRPLDALLSEPAAAAQTDNVVARLLVGEHPLVPPDEFIAAENSDHVTAEALDRLESLGHVDVVEAGADCWRRVAAWIDLDLRVGHRNVTESGPTASSAELGVASPALRARTSIDAALWAAAASWRIDGTSSAELRQLAEDAWRARQDELSRSTMRRIAAAFRRAMQRRVAR